MTRCDVIMVLGSRPDVKTWEFPSHVYKSLATAAELLKRHYAPCIALSGRWALAFDAQGITQPYLECDRMADYLTAKGVSAACILREGQSKDTISNLYYQKKTILEPRHFKHVLIITADFRLPRIKYVARKVLGPAYIIDYMIVPSQPGEAYPDEAETLARTKAFLGPMIDGDDDFLKNAFYAAPYYRM